jgi:hypothetical protein
MRSRPMRRRRPRSVAQMSALGSKIKTTRNYHSDEEPTDTRRRANRGQSRRVGAADLASAQASAGNMQTVVIATSGARDWMHGRGSAVTACVSGLLRPKHCHGAAENRGVMTDSDQFSMRGTRTRVLIECLPHEHCSGTRQNCAGAWSRPSYMFATQQLGAPQSRGNSIVVLEGARRQRPGMCCCSMYTA